METILEIGGPIDVYSNNEKLVFQVYSIIRRYAQTGYLEGLDNVQLVVQKKVKNFEFFLSLTDINEIKKIADEQLIAFWNSVNRLLTRTYSFELKDNELVKKKQFDLEDTITKVSEAILFNAHNVAIRSKLNNIPSSTNKNIGVGKTAAFGDIFKKIGSTIADAFSSFLSFDDMQAVKNKMQFQTKQDADVDLKICAPLEGTLWDVDDPNAPQPQMHPHCRCLMVPVVTEELEF